MAETSKMSDVDFILYWAEAGINYFGEDECGDYERFKKLAESMRKKAKH